MRAATHFFTSFMWFLYMPSVPSEGKPMATTFLVMTVRTRKCAGTPRRQCRARNTNARHGYRGRAKCSFGVNKDWDNKLDVVVGGGGTAE